MNHAVFTTRIPRYSIDDAVLGPINLIEHFLVMLIMAIGHQVTRGFPTFDVTGRYGPGGARQLAFASQKFLIDRGAKDRKALAPFVAQSGEPGSGDEAQGGGSSGGTGAIQSRQDVIRTLDRLCDYYGRAEPSSPVPLLLRRAQRLAEMNFLEIIGDLSPEALAPVQNVTGVKPAAPPNP